MANPLGQLALSNALEVEQAFREAFKRLGADDFEVKIGEATHPSKAATHQYVLLPRLAMKAEELSLMVFNVRLFDKVVYTTRQRSACGIQIQSIGDLPDSMLNDPNVQMTLQQPVCDEQSLTIGLRELLFELAIAESFDIDVENKLLLPKQQNMLLHKMFKSTPNYEDGQCVPLMPAELLSINELSGLMLDETPINALNRARAKAQQLLAEQRNRDRDTLEGPGA